MNILLINHYASHPALGMEYRPYYLAREWVRAGHRVLIVAATHSHVRSEQPAAGRQTVDGIEYLWLRTPAYRGNGFGRVLNIAAFLLRLRASCAQLARDWRPDVVIASSTYPMDIWVARSLARRAGARLVFEVHDLWPLSPIELSGMSPRHPFAMLCAAAERSAYREADRVVSMLPKVHDYMASRGLDTGKLVIVPNGISPDDWARPPTQLRDDVRSCIAAARAKGDAVIGYAGSMGLPNSLDTLLDAMARLRNQPLTLVMVGDGHERARLQQRIAREGLDQVNWFAPIPKDQIPSFLTALDIAYIGWQRVPIYRFGIAPNKLMDYMMAGCAILHSVEAGNDPVAEAGCGLTVPPEDPIAVATGLQTLAVCGVEERRAMGARGRAFVQAHHTYPMLARRFLDALPAGASGSAFT